MDNITIDFITPPDVSINYAAAQGLTGPMGPSGGSYEHSQSIALTIWFITHNLGYKPNVTVVDTGGSMLIGFGVKYIDDNSLELSFAGEVTGVAYLS